MRFPIVLCEGGARSTLWRQIIADILNVECAYAPSSQGAPVGDAVLAGVGVGIFKNYDLVKGLVPCGDKSIPSQENHARYMKLYAVFRSLYPALKSQYLDLAKACSTDLPLELARPCGLSGSADLLSKVCGFLFGHEQTSRGPQRRRSALPAHQIMDCNIFDCIAYYTHVDTS